jgi:hypothetical protein
MAQQAPSRGKIPTTGSRRRTTCRFGEARPPLARQHPGQRERAHGHPQRRPGHRAGARDHRLPGPRGPGPLASGLARERAAAAVRGGIRGEVGRQAGEGHHAAGSRCAQHDAARCGPDRVQGRQRVAWARSSRAFAPAAPLPRSPAVVTLLQWWLIALVSGRGTGPRAGSKGRSRTGRTRAAPAATDRTVSWLPNGRPRLAPSPGPRWTAPRP